VGCGEKQGKIPTCRILKFYSPYMGVQAKVPLNFNYGITVAKEKNHTTVAYFKLIS
jgi:hypothetical protein